MENVSKALTIAGGVMIAIMITGLLIFGFQKLRSYQNTQDEASKTAQVAEFNNQLEAFNKQVVPGYQIISLAHLIQDINEKSKDENFKEIALTVNINGTLGSFSNNNSFGDNFLKSKSNTITPFMVIYDSNNANYSDVFKQFKEMYFKCTDVETDNVNGRITKMSFKEISKIQ